MRIPRDIEYNNKYSIARYERFTLKMAEASAKRPLLSLKESCFFFNVYHHCYYLATCITLWPDLAMKNIVPKKLLLTIVIFLLFIVILHSVMTLFRFVKARISAVI